MVGIDSTATRGPHTPNPELVAAIGTWLSAAFKLPVTSHHPNFEFVPAKTLVALRHHRAGNGWPGSNASDDWAAVVDVQPEILAVYDDDLKTIYLREEWNGNTVADLSIVVHEMAHHLQNVAGLRYGCTEAREKLAFQAQEQWLELFGSDLENEFGIDPFTVLVGTSCPF